MFFFIFFSTLLDMKSFKGIHLQQKCADGASNFYKKTQKTSSKPQKSPKTPNQLTNKQKHIQKPHLQTQTKQKRNAHWNRIPYCHGNLQNDILKLSEEGVWHLEMRAENKLYEKAARSSRSCKA